MEVSRVCTSVANMNRLEWELMFSLSLKITMLGLHDFALAAIFYVHKVGMFCILKMELL